MIKCTFFEDIDDYGLTIIACDVVLQMFKEKVEVPVSSEMFVQCVWNKLIPQLGNSDRKDPHSVIIIDNCSIPIGPSMIKENDRMCRGYDCILRSL